MKKITELVVNSITLVTDSEKPAVKEATTKFSIFKTVWKAFMKPKITKKQKERLKKISENYKKTLKKWNQ